MIASVLLVLSILFSSIQYFNNKKRESKIYKEAYEAGYSDSSKEIILFFRHQLPKMVKDTNTIYCVDFYVNKDTIHLPMWSKNINVKKKK